MREINVEPYWPGVWNYIQSLHPTAKARFTENIGQDELEKIRLAAERVELEQASKNK